jgi:hypothetical protein
MEKNKSIPVVELDDLIPLIEGGSARFERNDKPSADKKKQVKKRFVEDLKHKIQEMRVQIKNTK